MPQNAENPARAMRGFPNVDLAGASITSETNLELRDLQARNIARHAPVGLSMAAVLAPVLYGEAQL